MTTFRYINAKSDLTTTNATTVYTVPSKYIAIVKSIIISEDSGNADTITVTLTDSSSNVFSLYKTKAISANGTTELLTRDLNLSSGEIIKCTAATGGRLHVVMSIDEYYTGLN